MMPTRVAADVFKHYVKVRRDTHRQNVVDRKSRPAASHWGFLSSVVEDSSLL